MVQIDVLLSNQIFRILEEWEAILKDLSKDVLLDTSEPEFWSAQHSKKSLKTDHIWSGLFGAQTSNSRESHLVFFYKQYALK